MGASGESLGATLAPRGAQGEKYENGTRRAPLSGDQVGALVIMFRKIADLSQVFRLQRFGFAMIIGQDQNERKI